MIPVSRKDTIMDMIQNVTQDLIALMGFLKAKMSFTNLLVWIGALGLAAQAFLGLSFFISSIWEKEKRAGFFAAFQFIGMSMLFLIFIFLAWGGFFKTNVGFTILIAGYVLSAALLILLVKRTASNKRALQGTKGLTEGQVKRFDERETVFSRVRSLLPGSEQHTFFYEKYPDYREGDDKKREMGGPPGAWGS